MSPAVSSASVFKIKYNIFLDTLIRKLFFQVRKINNFRGELTNISSKQEALAVSPLCARWAIWAEAGKFRELSKRASFPHEMPIF